MRTVAICESAVPCKLVPTVFIYGRTAKAVTGNVVILSDGAEDLNVADNAARDPVPEVRPVTLVRGSLEVDGVKVEGTRGEPNANLSEYELSDSQG